MIRRSSGVALAGPRTYEALSAASADAGVRLAASSSCPLAIIVRGVSVLSLVAGGLGYVLASFSPVGPFPSFRASTPLFDSQALRPIAWTPPRLIDPKPPEPPAVIGAAPQNPQVRRTFLTFLQSALASRKEVLQFGPMKVKRDIVQTIVRAAEETNTDPVLLMAIADKESSFSPSIEARSSSATGLFQFVDSTWLKAVREFGPRHGLAKEAAEIVGPEDRPTVLDPAERERILNLRKNPFLSAVLAAELLKSNGEKIAERIGRGLTGGETYLAHFLGPDDAERFMEKVVGQPHYSAASLLPRPARANASIFYGRSGRRSRKGLSVEAVHEKFEEMMGLRLDRYKSVGTAAGLSAFAETDPKSK